MNKDNLKLFVCHHPNQLTLYKNLAIIIKTLQPSIPIILLKVNHSYFNQLNFNPFKKYFDKIIELDFIHYKKNFLQSVFEILRFTAKLKQIIRSPLITEHSVDIFFSYSAFLPINIMLSRFCAINNFNIVIFQEWRTNDKTQVVDKIRTLFCLLYTSLFSCYKVAVVKTQSGVIENFIYQTRIPGTLVQVIGPTAPTESVQSNTAIHYPLFSSKFSKHDIQNRKSIIIIFGNQKGMDVFKMYLPATDILNKKLKAFLEALQNCYPNDLLWYKPHPSDTSDTYMPGITVPRYHLLNKKINAESLLENYNTRIKAVYTFMSSIVGFSAFLSLPSYTFYKYLVNDDGRRRFDTYFENIQSKFIYHISKLYEVGKIDTSSEPPTQPQFIDLNHIPDIYRRVLNI